MHAVKTLFSSDLLGFLADLSKDIVNTAASFMSVFVNNRRFTWCEGPTSIHVAHSWCLTAAAVKFQILVDIDGLFLQFEKPASWFHVTLHLESYGTAS